MKNIKALVVGATYFSLIFGITGFILNVSSHVVNIR